MHEALNVQPHSNALEDSHNAIRKHTNKLEATRFGHMSACSVCLGAASPSSRDTCHIQQQSVKRNSYLYFPTLEFRRVQDGRLHNGITRYQTDVRAYLASRGLGRHCQKLQYMGLAPECISILCTSAALYLRLCIPGFILENYRDDRVYFSHGNASWSGLVWPMVVVLEVFEYDMHLVQSKRER